MFLAPCAALATLRDGQESAAMPRYRRPPQPGEGILKARPGNPTGAISPGLHRLGLDDERDAALYVPAGYRADRPSPFVLSLHGAGGNELFGLYPLQDLADEAGILILSPASRGRTWDVLLGGFGPDVAYIDAALAWAFNRCAVDSARVAVSGFSDGASYALSLGITNGGLFPSVLAFSPGFAAPAGRNGVARFFVSHGTRDDVLRIDHTSRRVVPSLKDAGYDVTYVEFEGGHTVPTDVARKGLAWFLGDS
jgi:phospholipase/carboxylesterase